jgi:hypothetical protein
MAFETDGLAKAYAGAQNEAIRIKSYATSTAAAMAAGDVSANAVQQVMTTMKGAIELWDAASGTPGMPQYARDQQDDQGYNVIAEFLAMRQAAVDTRDWVINNFPKSNPGDFILKDKYEADGAITVRSFTNVETAGLQTNLLTLAAEIV